MAVTILDICNLALSRFGQSSISSLDDNTPQAKQCKLNYPVARDSVFREFPWNFALMSSTLSLSTYSVPGFRYAYIYPANCLSIRRVYAPTDARNATKGEYQTVTDGATKYICTDIDNACIDMTIQILDPSIYDSQFVNALSYLLATQIVIPLSGNSQRKQDLYAEYKYILSSAQISNAGEDNIQPAKTSSYKDSRR